MRLGRNSELEELKARVSVLEAAVHRLVSLVSAPGQPLSQWSRTAYGHPLDGFEAFITRHDERGHMVKRGVGDNQG
jgi:hypothetical protein